MRDGDDAEIRDHCVVMLKVNGFGFVTDKKSVCIASFV